MSDGPADFGATAAKYGWQQAGLPQQLVPALQARGVGLPDQHVVDLGLSYFARLLAPTVGSMRGIGGTERARARARRLCDQEGLAMEFLPGSPQATGLDAASVDVVIVGQDWRLCLHSAALAEQRRILRPGGKIALAHSGWLSGGDLAGQPNVVAVTERLIRAVNPRWPSAGLGVFPHWLGELAAGGFGGLSAFSFDLELGCAAEEWVSRVCHSPGIGGVLAPDQVAAFSDRLQHHISALFGGEVQVSRRIWAVVGQVAA